ncbi:hypothetical protein QUC31_006225 [Theobroma cacao]
MASLSRSSLLVALSFSIFFINPSFAKPRPNVTDAEIITICSKTPAPSFCLKVLSNETLHANQTSLHGLAKISIELALASADETEVEISPLIKQAENYTVREGYTLCSQNYQEAVASLKDAKRLLSKHDYRGVRVQALAALEEAEACEHDLRIPAFNPSPLHDKNEEFKHYCNIIWAITNRLVDYY